MNSGTIAFWVLVASSAIACLSVLLKLTWWKSSIGYWLFFMTAVLGVLCLFIFSLQLDFWPKWVREQARAIIYGSLAFVMWLLIIDIWRKNLHHWAWSKDDD